MEQIAALVAGGVDNREVPLGSAELFDPATGAFNLTGNMTAPRFSETATLLQNGNVMMAGGRDDTGDEGFAERHGDAADGLDRI